ncbi:MAG TPA: ATP-binding protein [Symbiobacteriaceae bacterium]|nr:ATP-binding protein [Symbiobacteriaceae bacterium]
MQFPILHIDGNLVANEQREVWAAYRLEPWHYDHLSHDERISRLGRLARLFWHFEENDGQLLVVPRRHGVREHMEQLKLEAGRGPLAEVGAAYCEGAAGYLESVLGPDSVDLEHYLLFRLGRPQGSRDFKAWAESVWREPKRLLEEMAGLRTPAPLPYELQAYREKEEVLFHRLSQVLRSERCAATDLAFLLRRAFYRGIPAPESDLRPAAVPQGVAQLAEGEMDLRSPRQISVTQVVGDGEATGYQAFCVLSELPDELPFPGSEWLFALQDLPFAVEVCVRWSCQGYQEALQAVRRKQLEITDQDRHTRKSGENIPLSLMDARDQATLLEHDLKQRKFPLVRATVSLVVAAADQRRLWERVKQVRDHLMARQIRTEVPAGDQLACFCDALPGSPRMMNEYRHAMPPEALAASMFLATRSLGDQTGPYLGRTGVLNKPVYLAPALPPLLDRSASMAFIGAPGGGKSFAANLISYLAVVTAGGRALILDPKGERTQWLELLPELAGRLNVVTLSPHPEDTGKLDPFVIGRGLGETGMREMGNLAISLLSFLTGARPGDAKFLSLVQAVEAVMGEEQPCLSRVVSHLAAMGDQRREAAELASYLKAVSNLAYANLLFGEGGESSIAVAEPLNILQLQNIVMPSPTKVPADYTLEEHLSVTLMHAVTAFATQFTRRDRDVFKIVLLDEAWSILGSSQGKALVGQLLRAGRAMNSAVYLVTQNCGDLLDETIKNNLSTKFVFRSRDRDEIAKVLEFLDLEPSEENEMTVRGLASGQALFQDLQGRVGVVQIDPIFGHLMAAFNTRPDRPAPVAGGGLVR